MKRTLILTIILATTALAGCVDDDTDAPDNEGTPSGNDANASGPDGDAPENGGETRELVILSHGSFYIGEEVIDAFEEAHNAKVTLVSRGDAAEVVNAAIIAGDRPFADLLFGVDNTLITRAKEAGIFEPYEPEAADTIRADLVFDDEWHVTPVDHGYVAINYDVAALEDLGLEPPTTLEELTEEQWKGKLVVENPGTSSPGLAFLLSTVSYFGTGSSSSTSDQDGSEGGVADGDYTYEDYWRDLKANDVKVAQGWSDAYFTYFSGGGYGGTYPLVVSYTTSPPYAVREACTTEEDGYLGLENCPDENKVMPTGNAPIPGHAWQQIEAMGVLKGAKNPDLAKAFIEHALTPAYQESAAFNMFVFPVTTNAEAPDFFSLVEKPAEPATLPANEITEDNVDDWLAGWSDAVIG